MALLTVCVVLLSCLLQSCVALGTTTAVVPWSESPPQPMPFTDPPHVRLRFSRDQSEGGLTQSYTFLVDTGSTGIITRADRLNVLESEPQTPGAYLFLTSSKILYKGFWVNRWVWFNKGTASEVRAQVPVLAVEHKCRCPSYVVGESGDSCPGAPYWNLPGIWVPEFGFRRRIPAVPVVF